MSYYDKSSLVLIPSGTNTGKVFSQKPTNGDGDFDFTRSTAATRVNADGNIEKETQNLLTHSGDLTNVDWVPTGIPYNGTETDPNGGSKGFSYTSNITNGRLRQTNTLSGGVYTFSAYLKSTTNLSVNIRLDSNNGTFTNYPCALTTEWQRFEFYYVHNSASLSAWIGGGLSWTTGEEVHIAFPQLEQGLVARDYIETTTTALYGGITDNVPRLDYTDSSCPALLLEPQRTNTVINSEYIAGYSSSGTTITQNYGISPEGVQNSARVQFSGGGYIAFGVTTYTNEVTSMYVKGTAGEKIRFGKGANVAQGALYTLTGDWQRIVYDVGSTSSTFIISNFNDATANDFEVYGLQHEEGSYPTSYIPTYGTSVTRNAETCTDAGNTATFNSTEGVLYAEIAALDNTQSASQYITISDGTYNNRLSILYSNGATNTIRAFLRVGGSSQVDFSSSLTNQKDFNKIAFKYKENDFALWINGVEVATDTSGSVSSDNTLNDLAFSEIGTSQAPFYGKTKELIYFPTALSDADLEILTGTYYESYSAMAAALNYKVYE